MTGGVREMAAKWEGLEQLFNRQCGDGEVLLVPGCSAPVVGAGWRESGDNLFVHLFGEHR